MRRLVMIKKLLVVGIVGAMGWSGVRAQQTVPPPPTPETLALERMAQQPRNLSAQLDLIRIYIETNRLAEAELLLTRALSQVREQRAMTTAGAPPPQTGAPVIGPVRVGGDIKEPLILKKVPPVYPPIAQSAGVTGVVIIEALIDFDGSVRQARILRSVALLDQAALDAVQQWRFTPTLLNGAPVQVVMTVTVNFSLN
jgi:TonB family protein